jgi:hypothetical protein
MEAGQGLNRQRRSTAEQEQGRCGVWVGVDLEGEVDHCVLVGAELRWP